MATETQLSVMAKTISEVNGKLGREMTSEELANVADEYFNVMNPPGWIGTPMFFARVDKLLVDCREWKAFSDTLLGLDRPVRSK